MTMSNTICLAQFLSYILVDNENIKISNNLLDIVSTPSTGGHLLESFIKCKLFFQIFKFKILF